jgi:tetratricopeptide (TPR) repeat protein
MSEIPPSRERATSEPLVFGGKTLRHGERIGSYVFEREIGSGGMARVLLARDPAGEPVALKVLRASRIDTGLLRFRREFHALSRISHPNIIRVDAYGDLHGHPYIAMEYVDGPDLHTVIRSFRNWPDAKRYERCQEILIDLCRALAAIHRRGLVHRDLKPSNVLLTRSGQCKLTDFGIVKELDGGRNPLLSTTLVGTWAYTSPEHISGQPIDHRSDLYSLGVILFALLTGKRPFVADNMAGYLEQHRDKAAPQASRVRAGVPSHLDEICSRLLEKAPRDRFQSAQEILYRLEADDDASALDDGATWEPPLVGNQDAIEGLEDAVAALTDRRGGVVRLIGDDGSGRSRLMRLAVDRARSLGLPYHLHTFSADAPVFTRAVSLARELLSELPDDEGLELRRTVTAYSEGSALRGDTRYALYDGIREVLRAALAERPRLLLLDDVHLAAPQEVELFHYQIRSLLGTEPCGLLVVEGRRGLQADETAPQLGLAPVTSFQLQPLRVEDLQIMVAGLIGPGRSSELLARRLHDETGGNPYFASEFLRSLISQNLITRSDNGWQLSIDPAELAEGHLEIPPSIRQVIRGRLEGILPEDRAVLEVLALRGEHSDFDLLFDVLQLDDEERLLKSIDRLLAASLVQEQRHQGEFSYQIIHRKLAEILERDMPEPHLRELHRAIATAMERSSAQDPESLAVIGEHYRRANEGGRAFRHLVTAAQRLSERSMSEEAWALSQKAAQVEVAAQVDLPPHEYLELRLEHLRIRGEALQNHANWEEAEQVYRELLASAQETSNDRMVCDARLQLSRTLRRRGHNDESLAEAQEALKLARRLHFRRGVAEALHNLAVIAWKDGDLEKCEALANEGLLVAQGPQLATERARLLLAHAISQATRGQLASATRGLVEAEGLFRELRMKHPRVLVQTNIAELLLWQGDPEEAWSRADEALKTAEALGYRLGVVVCLRQRGVANLDLGRYDEAQDDLHAVVLQGQRISQWEEVIAGTVALTQLALERNDPTGALCHAATGIAAAEHRDPERFLPWLQALIARGLARRRPAAAWHALQAVEDAIPTLHTPRQMQVRVAAAWAWLALGDVDKAIEHANEVVSNPRARSFRLLNLEARALLAAHTTGETARRHQQLGAELARDYADALPISTNEELRKRPFFKHLDGPTSP